MATTSTPAKASSPATQQKIVRLGFVVELSGWVVSLVESVYKTGRTYVPKSLEVREICFSWQGSSSLLRWQGVIKHEAPLGGFACIIYPLIHDAC
jgi:hypothetical protein